jgi:murein L,D-transpeptidase YcbB/YkuD
MLLALMVALVATDTTGIGDALRTATLSEPPHWMRWRTVTDVRPALEVGYAERGWAPFWLDGAGAPTPAARLLIGELAGLADRGLDPTDYDAGALKRRMDSLGTATEMAGFDAALSVAALRVARALDRGRVHPATLHPTLRLPRAPFDGVGILKALAASASPAVILRDLEPNFYQYHRLRGVLQRYRALALDTTLRPLPPGPRVVRPDSVWVGAAPLRRLLRAVGDHPDPLPPPEGDTILDAGLAAAVQRFQRRHGVTADGLLGPATRTLLTRPWAEQIRQVELTLERWRWLPRTHPIPPAIVNIPAFRAYALTSLPEREAETLTMDIVVGTATRFDTPLLALEMTSVNFHPYWNVPTSIARDEIRPKALASSDYLRNGNYELLRGTTVVPITAENIAAIGGAVRVRQTPGPHNALGRVKFDMPNPENIYLHDTPARSLFERVRRDFSHGCIRLADPAAFAEWALRDLPEWTRARIDSVMAGNTPLEVALPRKIPVYIVYQTVLARESGDAYFYGDLYGHDAKLDAALRRGYPYPGTTLNSLP